MGEKEKEGKKEKMKGEREGKGNKEKDRIFSKPDQRGRPLPSLLPSRNHCAVITIIMPLLLFTFVSCTHALPYLITQVP